MHTTDQRREDSTGAGFVRNLISLNRFPRLCAWLLAGSLTVLFPLLPVAVPSRAVVVRAATLEELNRKKEEMDRKAQEAEKAAKAQQTVAQRAAGTITEVSSKIGQLEGAIASTEGGISSTGTQIEQRNQQVAELEAELRKIKDQQDALVRQMYILRQSAPDTLVYFSDEPVSARESRQAQLSALKKSVTALFQKTTTAKAEVEQVRSDLVKRNNELQLLKAQQDEQKRGLANYRYLQSVLKENAEDAQVAYEQQAEKAHQEAAKIENQITAALAARRANAAGVFGKGPGVGSRVRRGDFVGIQGSTGFSTGDHVHLEVDLNGPANGHVSPWPYLNNGTIDWPLRSFVITQNYGVRNSWYSIGYHMGIDIAGPVGSPVYAPANGIVVLNEYFGGYGNAWVMKVDDGPYVLIGHLRQ